MERPGFHGDLIICLESHHCQRLREEPALPEGLLELHRRNITTPGVQPLIEGYSAGQIEM
jgi:hypothetical protein